MRFAIEFILTPQQKPQQGPRQNPQQNPHQNIAAEPEPLYCQLYTAIEKKASSRVGVHVVANKAMRSKRISSRASPSPHSALSSIVPRSSSLSFTPLRSSFLSSSALRPCRTGCYSLFTQSLDCILNQAQHCH